jgi:excisionase family DNA binding protein
MNAKSNSELAVEKLFDKAGLNPSLSNAMTIRQFCAWAGIARSTVYKEIASGRLKARKIGHKTIIAREDAEAWFQALPALVSRAS